MVMDSWRTRTPSLLTALAFAWLLPCGVQAQQQEPTPAAGLHAALRSALSLHPAVSGKQAQVDAKTFGGDAVRSLRYPTLTAQAQQLTTTGRALEILPSMTARVDIRTGERSLMDYLLMPQKKTFSNYFGVR